MAIARVYTRQRAKRGAPIQFLIDACASDTDDCITWPFGRTPNGYGKLKHDGRVRRAHRVALKLSKGEPPEGKPLACHAPVICHNRLCVNPKHLRWASPLDNVLDMALDGTAQIKKPKKRANPRINPIGAFGEKNSKSKLNETQVLDIRKDTRKYTEISQQYGIGISAISKIKNGVHWSWLKDNNNTLTL